MLILASNSPRRRELLALGRLPFQVAPVEIDEQPLTAEDPLAYVLRLAESKARAAARQLAGAHRQYSGASNFALIRSIRSQNPLTSIRSIRSHASTLAHPLPAIRSPGASVAQALIVAADTTVADGKSILGKPRDAAEAESMLRSLRGRTHQVFTGLAVHHPASGALLTDWCLTEVPMRDYSDEEMQVYIASGDPLDKAGAYAIQHAEFNPVAGLSGCYANVMGLPLCHLRRTLAKLGFELNAGIAQACQSALAYSCPVYAQVLSVEVHTS